MVTWQAEVEDLRQQLAALGAQWEEFAAAERAGLERQLQAARAEGQAVQVR